MKLKYTAKKGKRINYGFVGFCCSGRGWWYNRDTNQWEETPKGGVKWFSSHQDCKTVKSFRRKLKSAPKGVRFELVSRWVGHSVSGVGTKEN